MQKRELGAGQRPVPMRVKSFGKPVRVCDGDDLAAAVYEDEWEDELQWRASAFRQQPSADRAYRARRRLETRLERMRLEAEIAEVFGEDYGDGATRSRRSRGRKNGRHRQRPEA